MKDYIIRIQKISIANFKGVRHGEIEFNSLKNIPESIASSNILGLYGQNGSGKTTFLEALFVLKTIMSGECLPVSAVNYISKDAEAAHMQVVFEVVHPDRDDIEFLTYKFSLRRRTINMDTEGASFNPVEVFNETVSKNVRDSKGKLVKKTYKLYDSNSTDDTVGCHDCGVSYTRVDMYDIEDEKEFMQAHESDDYVMYGYIDVENDRKESLQNGGSALFFDGGPAGFVFGRVDIDGKEWEFENDLPEDRFTDLNKLSKFAKQQLFVVGANLFNAFSGNHAAFYLSDKYSESVICLSTDSSHSANLNGSFVRDFEESLDKMNIVLSSIIPGLKLSFDFKAIPKNKKMPPKKVAEANKEFPSHSWNQFNFEISFFTERNGIRVPLANESEGIKRIIYCVELLIRAYNDPSTTIAIDELDAGIFEFLLGEILRIFESSGRGQLIFTSHNLRPLEVISRKFICFTTTNPDNRYIRLKYIGKTNNLRDVYFRQILIGEQDEEIYNSAKSYKLKEAFERAGDNE